MEVPYTTAPADAFIAAQTSVGAALSGLVWYRPLKSVAASIALLAAIWLAILNPALVEPLNAMGAKLPPEARVLLLEAAASLATGAMLLSRPRWLAIVALAGQLSLLWMSGKTKDTESELAALSLIFFAALWAMSLRCNRPWERPSESVGIVRSHLRSDLFAFGIAVGLALVVGYFVLDLTLDSSDEWGYNWLALVFARFKAYAPIPRCPEAHRNHWVFYYQGRAIAMYLPGWPLFMAPFARLGVPWLAAPVAFGAMIVAIGRLGRRVAGETAGIIATVIALLGAMTLMNAGSRYLHCFTAALFAWSVESVCAITEEGLSRRAQWGWGAVLGVTVALSASSRPPDAVFLGAGVYLYFLYALARRKVGWRSFVGAAVPFAMISALALIILRLQTGAWFKTGYDVAVQFYWWTKLVLNIPQRDAWKYGIPLATGAYCYFPAAAALGVAGLIIAGRRVSFMLGLGALGLLGWYTACAFGRYRDFGYGPRYHLPIVIAMAVGTGVLFAPLFANLRRRLQLPAALVHEGTAVLAFAAMVIGLVRLAPLLYPYAHGLLHQRSAIFRAIEREKLVHAVVTVRQWDTAGGPLLDTQNDPFDPNPNVIILSPDDPECTRELYKDRAFYRANGMDEVTLTPF